MQLKFFLSRLTILKFACLHCRARAMVGLILHPFILLKLPGFECLAEKGSLIISLPSQHCPDLLSLVSAILGNVQNAG